MCFSNYFFTEAEEKKACGLGRQAPQENNNIKIVSGTEIKWQDKLTMRQKDNNKKVNETNYL